ncbi:MAG: hypothetical protein WC297_00655 [Candidatus Paceibacterota bacterium]|jgi:asparagine N-glycosylation enzyme membrane subunit Stt3
MSNMACGSIVGFSLLLCVLGIILFLSVINKILSSRSGNFMGFYKVLATVAVLMILGPFGASVFLGFHNRAAASSQSQSFSAQTVSGYGQAREHVSTWQATISDAGEMRAKFYISSEIKPKTLTIIFTDKHDQPLTEKKYTLTEIK